MDLKTVPGIHTVRAGLIILGAIGLLLLGCERPQGGASSANTPDDTSAAGSTGQVTSLSPTPSPTATATPSPTPTPAPATRLQLARQAAYIGDLEAAIRHYRALTEVPALTREALFELGRLYEWGEQWIEARDAWKAYLVAFPDDSRVPYVHFRLGRSYAALGKHEQAIKQFRLYDEVRDLADDVVADALGQSLRALDRQQEAAEQFERLYEHPTADRVTRALTARTLGDIYTEIEDWSAAAEWYERSLDDSRIPWFRAVLIDLIASAEAARDNLDVAIEWWQELVADYPQTPEARRALTSLAEAGAPASLFQQGIVYYENGEWDAAVTALYNSIEQEADRAEAHLYAARAYAGAGNVTAAWREYGVLIDTHPESDLRADAWVERARLRADQDDVDGAVAAYLRAAADFPDDEAAPTALWEAARLLAERDELERAASFYLMVSEQYPEDEDAERARWEAGLLYFRSERYERATSAWKPLTETASYAERAAYWLGKAAARDDPEAARSFWEEAAAGDGYYAARARAQLAGETWQARRTTGTLSLTAPQSDLGWLRAAFDVEEDEPLDLFKLPELPERNRGDELYLLGEIGSSVDAYRQAVAASEDDPRHLYALARYFAGSAPHASIAAARRLQARLGFSFEEAPSDLARLIYPLHFTSLLLEQADRYGIDPLLLAALVYQESLWQPEAQSVAGARGLTQVIPSTGEWIAQRLGEPYADYRLLQPMVSLRYGAYYLDWILDHFEDNPFYALAGYNGGPGNIERWMADDVDLFVENITFPETRTYVEQVYLHWQAYDALYR